MARTVVIDFEVDIDGNPLRSIQDITDEIKRLEQVANTADIGSDAFNQARQDADRLTESLTNLKEGNDEVAESADNLSSSNDGLGSSLDNLGGGFGGAISGAKALGQQFLALIANPIGLVIAAVAVVLGTLFKAFSRTEEGGNSLNKGMTILSGVVSSLFKAIEPLANFIVDEVVGAFESLGRAAEQAAELTSDALRFLGFDEAADSVDNLSESTGTLIAQTTRLADLEARLIVDRREQRLIQRQALIDAENLRQLRDDESRGIDARIQSNEELGRVLARQAEQELAIANRALEAAQLRLEIDGRTTEALDGLTDAQEELLEIEERINGQQSEQLSNLNSLRKERSSAAAESAQQSKDRIQQTRDEAAATIKANQDVLRATQDSQDDVDRIREESRLRNLSDNEASIAREIAETVAGFEEQFAIIQENEERIRDDKTITEEERIAALKANSELEIQIAKDQANAIREINDRAAKADAEALLLQQEQEQEQAIIDSENEELTFQERRELLNQRNEEIANDANLTEKQKTAFLAQSAAARKAIGQSEVNARLDQASQVTDILSSLTSLAGEQTAASKGLAVASATINTFRGVSDALAAVTVTPFETALKFANAAAIGAAGIANVRNILSVQVPSVAGGGAGGAAPSMSAIPAAAPEFVAGSTFSSQTSEGVIPEEVGDGAGLNQQPVRAFVIDRDIEDATSLNATLANRARLG